MENEMRVKKRRLVYEYIKNTVNRITVGHRPQRSVDEITELADVLRGKFGLKDALRGLKDGTSDPTDQLIEAFTDYVGQTVPDFEISANLIEPFKPDS
jgi:hypothetical protein